MQRVVRDHAKRQPFGEVADGPFCRNLGGNDDAVEGNTGRSNPKRYSERRQTLTQAIPLAARPGEQLDPLERHDPPHHQFRHHVRSRLPPNPGPAPRDGHSHLLSAAPQIGQRCQVLDAQAGTLDFFPTCGDVGRAHWRWPFTLWRDNFVIPGPIQCTNQ